MRRPLADPLYSSSKRFQIAMLSPFEMFGRARNHGRKVPKIVSDLLLAVSSINEEARRLLKE